MGGIDVTRMAAGDCWLVPWMVAIANINPDMADINAAASHASPVCTLAAMQNRVGYSPAIVVDQTANVLQGRFRNTE